MASISTIYLSRIIGNPVLSGNRERIGRFQDFIVDLSFERPKVIAAKIKFGWSSLIVDFANISITKVNTKYTIICHHIEEITVPEDNTCLLGKYILDKQIVDLDGRKLVRVNDIRLAIISTGAFLIAVDVGIEGLFRRLAIAKPIKKLLKPFGKSMPSKMILWDDVSTINFGQRGIQLSKSQEKLSMLHPSDLADIIEDLDRKTQLALFSSLDEEKAADVLEELETEAQVHLLEHLPVGKAADLLEKMPADEVADILDDLEEERAEELLDEMEEEASEEVRELMEYPENTVGSLMTTDFISFKEEMTVDDTINELRREKPESDMIYYLYVLDKNEKLIASVSLRDLITADSMTPLKTIMRRDIVKVRDYEKLDSLAEIISKYNLLAIPVVDIENKLLGMVIIDDVVFTLLKTRRRKMKE
ncbi:MAG: MgtE intracellular region [Ignavibacteria bacterium]|nr:MgtE intracellular region [Ignavibacteria bacterium]